MNKTEILFKVEKLIAAHKQGLLGGEKMPEDSRPNLLRSSEENILYLTLPMALNYQRNSYKLWESALLTWEDLETKTVFNPSQAINLNIDTLRQFLVKYKVALQQNKQPLIWQKLCQTFVDNYDGKVLNLLAKNDYRIDQILNEIQIEKKKYFPYLSGNKIANYWLFVLTQYTDLPFKNKDSLSIAPDTHICQASLKLGLSSINESPLQVAEHWKVLLSNSGIYPIDIHTPLWLWSRGNFSFQV